MLLNAEGQPIQGDGEQQVPQPGGGGKIRGAVAKMMEQRRKKAQVEAETKEKEMVPVGAPTKESDRTLSFTHKEWVKIYSDLLDHILSQAAEKIIKLSAIDGFIPHYEFNQRLYTDMLPAGHSSGAAAVVGVEISIKENGVTRKLIETNRFFRTTLEFKVGKDQGLMEAIQQVYTELITFAITTDIATRYEQQQKSKEGPLQLGG